MNLCILMNSIIVACTSRRNKLQKFCFVLKKKSISLFNKKDVYRINDVLYTIYAMSCWNEKHKIVCKTVSLTLFHEFNNIRAACQFCHRCEGHTLIKSPGVTQVWIECWATFRPVWIVNPILSHTHQGLSGISLVTLQSTWRNCVYVL